MTDSTKKGVLLALITSFISGVAIFYNKLVIVKGIDPLIFNILKNGGVAFILSFFLLTKPHKKTFFRLSPFNFGKLILIGAIGGSLPFILYFEGLKTVSPVSANLIHKTLFLFTASMAIPFLGEKLNFQQVAAYLLIAISNLFIGGFVPFSGSAGELMILGATLFWAVENIIIKSSLPKIEADIIAWGRMFFGSLILVFLAFWQNKLVLFSNLTPSLLVPVTGSIILLTFYVTIWTKALKYAPATLVTSILILATPLTNILTVIFINRSPTAIQPVHTAITIFSISIIIFFSKKTPSRTFRHLS